MKQVEVEVKVEVEMYETFRDMPVWQQAIDVAERIFGLTEGLPRKEDYGFTSQIRRSALSIAANIAEAFGRNHTYDKINFSRSTFTIYPGDLLPRLRATWSMAEG